jgi:hypothetical protein
MFVVLTLVAGSAEARILPFGHKAEKVPAAASAGDQRVCTTTTTVVRRGDVVLSTTSTTRCEEDTTQAAAPTQGAAPQAATAETAPSGAPARARASAPAATFKSSHSVAAASLFGLGPRPALTPRDVLGVWTAIERGKQDACTVLMSREVVSGGFRVFTSGCKGPLSGASAWRFEETAAGLYGSDGAPLGKLAGDKEHLAGTLAGGGLLEMSR